MAANSVRSQRREQRKTRNPNRRPPCQGRPFRVTVLPLDRESLIHVHRGRHFRVTGLPSAPRRQRGSAPPPRQAHSRHLDPPPPFAILVLPPTLNHAVSAAALPKTTNSTDNCSQTATIQDLKVANSTYRLPGPALPQSARARLDSWLRRVGILPSGPPARAAEARKRADSEQRRNLTLRNGNMKRFVRTPSTGWLGGSKNRDARSLACSKNVCSLFFSGVGLLEDGTAGSVTAQRAPPRRDLSVGAERPARSGARKPGPREAPRRPPRRPCPYQRQRFPHPAEGAEKDISFPLPTPWNPRIRRRDISFPLSLPSREHCGDTERYRTCGDTERYNPQTFSPRLPRENLSRPLGCGPERRNAAEVSGEGGGGEAVWS